MPAREVNLANHHPRLRLDRRAVIRVIHFLDAHFSLNSELPTLNRDDSSAVPAGELSLVFLTDPALAQLHATFLADPTITDVITFEGNSALGTAGEICVSVDAALRHVSPKAPTLSSKLSALSSAAFSTELTLYLVHGWLHLAGYDDLQAAKKRIMRRAEARAMSLLHANDCIPSFRLK
jgi:probable rRNA maturation factor